MICISTQCRVSHLSKTEHHGRPTILPVKLHCPINGNHVIKLEQVMYIFAINLLKLNIDKHVGWHLIHAMQAVSEH